MMKAAVAVAVLAASLAVTPASAEEPTPVVKQGACPSGYYPNGNYCAPAAGAKPAIPKRGACPSGYRANGSYCLAARDARPAVPRKGACPAGYSGAGEYCLKNK
jgi:hypothetical protein